MNAASTNRTPPWTKHYDSEVPVTLNYPEVTLDELFRKSVENYAAAITLIFFDLEMRYNQLGRYAQCLNFYTFFGMDRYVLRSV